MNDIQLYEAVLNVLDNLEEGVDELGVPKFVVSQLGLSKLTDVRTSIRANLLSERVEAYSRVNDTVVGLMEMEFVSAIETSPVGVVVELGKISGITPSVINGHMEGYLKLGFPLSYAETKDEWDCMERYKPEHSEVGYYMNFSMVRAVTFGEDFYEDLKRCHRSLTHKVAKSDIVKLERRADKLKEWLKGENYGVQNQGHWRNS